MKKYLALIKTEIQRNFTYRANILTWRLSDLMQVLVQILIWSVVFEKAQVVQGYSYREMMTYVIIGTAFTFFTYNFGFENLIANHIQLGQLSNFISKPVSYIKYIVALSLGRIFIALSMSVVINLSLIFIFHDRLIFYADAAKWLLIFLMLLMAYFIQLFLTILVGFVAFWTTDIGGVFYSLTVLSRFMSGTYFPINLLPAAFVNFSLALPFVYTFYYPVQLYLGKISLLQGITGLGLEAVWLFALYFAVRFVWKIGLKKYESLGI